MNRHVFDASFKRMAIDLSYARGSVKEVADDLRIDPARMSKWRQKVSSPMKSTIGLTEKQKEIKRLKKELKEAQLERAILKKAISISRIKSGIFNSPGETGGIGFHKRTSKPVSPPKKMYKVLQVCASGYYYWLKSPISLRELKEQELVPQIKEIYQQSKCRYGIPRISFELQAQGIRASRPRVARVMRKW